MKPLYIIKAIIRILIGFDYKKLARERLESFDTIFVHIPKTAGKSLCMALYGSSSSHHAKMQHYIEVLGLPNVHTKRWFAIIRNPEERLISAYAYLTQNVHPMNRAWYYIYMRKYRNLNEFILSGGLAYAIEKQAEHFIPQVEYLKYNECICDCVKLYSFECFINNLELHKDLNIVSLPNINKSEKPANIHSNISAEARAVLYKIYEEDYSLLQKVKSSE